MSDERVYGARTPNEEGVTLRIFLSRFACHLSNFVDRLITSVPSSTDILSICFYRKDIFFIFYTDEVKSFNQFEFYLVVIYSHRKSC